MTFDEILQGCNNPELFRVNSDPDLNLEEENHNKKLKYEVFNE